MSDLDKTFFCITDFLVIRFRVSSFLKLLALGDIS